MTMLTQSGQRSGLHSGTIRPHDLLKIATVEALVGEGPAPDWAIPALAAAAWVVVRRAEAPVGWIPVGVRGPLRHDRWAALLPTDAIVERVTPEAAGERFHTLPPQRRMDIPALAAVPRLAVILAEFNLCGGPTGSIGFELVTGRAVATVTSDIDAVVRADTPLGRPFAATLAAAVAQLPARCDLLFETPNGAVALAEYVGSAGMVALRGPHGPRLVADPWAASIG